MCENRSRRWCQRPFNTAIPLPVCAVFSVFVLVLLRVPCNLFCEPRVSSCTLRVTQSTGPRGKFEHLSVGSHRCPVTATELYRREPQVLLHVAAVPFFHMTAHYSYVLLLQCVCSPVRINMPNASNRRQRRPLWYFAWLVGHMSSRKTSHRETDTVASHSWRSFFVSEQGACGLHLTRWLPASTSAE